MLVTAIRALGNGRGTDIGFERRPVPGGAADCGEYRQAARAAIGRKQMTRQQRGHYKSCFIGLAKIVRPNGRRRP
jgi:hypothetical protein